MGSNSAPRITDDLLDRLGFVVCHSCGRYGQDAVCRNCGAERSRAATEAPARKEAGGGGPKARTGRLREPTKTEVRYNAERLDGRGVYEGLAFRLSNGHRYTPDWVVVTDGGFECHEVKGAYRLGSYQRARLAFDQAKVEWPAIRWVWAERTKDGWRVER